MPYTPQSVIDRKRAMADALRGNMGQQLLPNPASGLAYVLNQYMGGRASRRAREAQEENEKIRRGETQSLIQAMTNNAGGTLQGPGNPQLAFETPELQNLQIQQQLANQQHQRDLEKIEAQQKMRQRYGTGQGNFKGQPVTDETGRVVGHYVQTPTGFQFQPVEGIPEGARVNPTAYIAEADSGLRGSAREEDVADLVAARPEEVDTAGQIEAIEGFMQGVNERAQERYSTATNAAQQNANYDRISEAPETGS